MVELTHEEVLMRKKLPRVGQTIRNRESGALWRVMEKREVWQNIPDDPGTGQPRLVPAVYLAFWQIKPGEVPGIGAMSGYAYTLYDNTFEANWEVVE